MTADTAAVMEQWGWLLALWPVGVSHVLDVAKLLGLPTRLVPALSRPLGAIPLVVVLVVSGAPAWAVALSGVAGWAGPESWHRSVTNNVRNAAAAPATVLLAAVTSPLRWFR